MWFHNYAYSYERGLKLHPNKTDIRPEIHGDMVGFQLQSSNCTGHLVALCLGLFNNTVDFGPVNLIGNGAINNQDGLVNLEIKNVETDGLLYSQGINLLDRILIIIGVVAVQSIIIVY